MQIVKYTSEYKTVWDSFVRQSKNGTFLLCRDFMEYHSDRFIDYSLMFYDKNNLLAILPANISDDTLYSHQGLTYGGVILSHQAKANDVLSIFSDLIAYIKEQEKCINKIVYKPVPYIYHNCPSDEDLYALFRNDFKLCSRAISSTIDMTKRLPYSQLRKRQIKKASGQELQIQEDGCFADFWKILEDNLQARFGKNPVHSLDEIESLKSKFPTEIRLFSASKDGNVVAGCLVFEMEQVAHVQYISANEEGKNIGALDFLFDHLINNVFAEKMYFDFGISTEDNGHFLNSGLIGQKEGFGGRGVVYDTYTTNIE